VNVSIQRLNEENVTLELLGSN